MALLTLSEMQEFEHEATFGELTSGAWSEQKHWDEASGLQFIGLRLVITMQIEAQCKCRHVQCGQHTLVSFGNPSVEQINQQVTNHPMEELGNPSLVDYAKTTSGVYIWISEQSSAREIKHESHDSSIAAKSKMYIMLS